MALIAHVAQGSPDTNGFTTSAIDTTGANFLAVALSDSSGAGTISDSKGNTWTKAVGPTTINGPDVTIYYATAPTVGSGHTFTVTDSAASPSIYAAAFSGVATTTPLDKTAQANAGFAASLQPGSVTPAQNGELILTAVCYVDTANALAIDSGFTILDQILQQNGAHFGGGFAYLVQPTAAAVNPTWSDTGASGTITGAVIASFKPGASGPTNPFPAGYGHPDGYAGQSQMQQLLAR